MNTPFDWNLVRSFLAVLEHGSLLGAARALQSSQPTMGRHVAELEAQLGTVLFERTGRGLQPTATALRLAELARAMEAGAHALARGGVGQIGAHHLDQTALDAFHTRHDRQQRGFAHAIGPDQTHGAARGQAQGHVLQGQRVAVAVRHVLHANCGVHGVPQRHALTRRLSSVAGSGHSGSATRGATRTWPMPVRPPLSKLACRSATSAGTVSLTR